MPLVMLLMGQSAFDSTYTAVSVTFTSDHAVALLPIS